MPRTMLLALALFGVASLSCGGRSSPTAPASNSRLDILVSWEGRGVSDRLLEIVELGSSLRTDAAGRATFNLPAGSYTLRAYVNGPGPPAAQDYAVTTRAGETVHMDVVDCLPCVSPRMISPAPSG
jgi:hypothetical protein